VGRGLCEHQHRGGILYHHFVLDGYRITAPAPHGKPTIISRGCCGSPNGQLFEAGTRSDIVS
jgi:hypothetical protein